MGHSIKRDNNLCFKSDRRFGVELEILAFDGKNRPPGGEKDKPAGTDYVVSLVKNRADENVEWRVYEHTHNNYCWVVKPDSSCGLEICTPIYRNWRGIRKICHVVEAFSKDPLIKVDERCSVHVHVDVSDLTEEMVASTIIHWVKCEAVFLDMVPFSRKINRYCQFLCARDNFDTEYYMSPQEIISSVGDVKYYTANTKQWMYTGGKRKTLEFRIIEGEGCKDPYLIKNWLRLILHFVEMTSKYALPPKYKQGDQWSWICMLDTIDVLRVLGFFPGQYNLSPGLQETRNWMLARLKKYMNHGNSFVPREKSYQELLNVLDILEKNGTPINESVHLSPTDLNDAVYNDNFRF